MLIDVYAEVYADRLHEPFNSVERFAERLDGHVTTPNWQAVVGWDATEPVGYIYAASLRPGSTWWSKLEPPVDEAFAAETGHRTCGIFELMVRKPWRGTGAAQAIHDDLLAHRNEERASLGVERAHPRVRAMYERWGYRYVGTDRPFPDSPLLDVMVKDLRR
ncbi:MAG TPA: GNAT family N-acetyltransferase [Cryptosporangiaceae bacterium]|nr:GNAT family N-acetyltransferase [Cryptosporangiaceae bacterium]